MKYVSSLVILGLLTGCDAPVDSSSSNSISSSSVSESEGSSSSGSGSESSSSVSPTHYVYLLIAGKVCAYPIDPDTHDLIQPEYGIWCVGAASSHNFFSMVMDSSGSYLYASDATGSKIYQYSIIQDSPYSNYGSNIPLTALSPATFNTNSASGYMSFGSNGNLYIENYLYTPVRVDKLALTNGVISYVSMAVQSTEAASYGMTFGHITSVVSGSDTYTISGNRIIRSVGGIAQSSFQPIQSGTLSAIALH